MVQIIYDQSKVKTGTIKFDEIGYGNLSENYRKYLNEETVLDPFIDDFYNYPFPTNSSEETKKEIEFLISLRQTAPKMAETYAGLDEDLKEEIGTIFYQKDLPLDFVILDKVFDQSQKLIVALKQHYNRARPYQLANLLSMPLYPAFTISGNSPAYPSGHAFQAQFLCDLHSLKFPQHKKQYQAIAKMVCDSRESLGVHYPSDNEFSRKISIDLLQHDEVIAYFLG